MSFTESSVVNSETSINLNEQSSFSSLKSFIVDKNNPYIQTQDQEDPETGDLCADDNYLEKILQTDSWTKADFQTKLNFFTQNSTYTWNNISASVKEPLFSVGGILREICKKEVPVVQHIDPICGVARSGEILAIVGGCGVGKTTLLNILSFRHSSRFEIHGDRRLNGVPVDGRIIKEISSYVQNQDIFIPLVTVKEHLMFTIMLRSRAKRSFQESVERVNLVLKETGLWDRRDFFIGPSPKSNLIRSVRSGGRDRRDRSQQFTDAKALPPYLLKGERKLLALAAEMLTDPKILFCECLTAGLDHHMSLRIMKLLRRFSDEGNMVIVSTESSIPRAFLFYDCICVMTGGRVGFFGTPREALHFWASQGLICPPTHSPIDYFIATTVQENQNECLDYDRMQEIDQIVNSFQNTEIFHKLQVEATGQGIVWKTDSKLCLEKDLFREMSRYRATWCRQLYWLYMREATLHFRSLGPFYGLLFLSVVSAVFYGLVFWQQEKNDEGARNISIFLAFSAIHTMLVSTAASIISMGKYLRVFHRESYKRSYRSTSYFLAKNLVDFPVYILSPWIFVLISFPMVGIGTSLSSPAVYFGLITLIIASTSSCSLGYILVLTLGSQLRAFRITHNDVCHLFLLSGMILNTDTLIGIVTLLHDYSIPYQVIENLMVKQWEDVTEIKLSAYRYTVDAGPNHMVQDVINNDTWFHFGTGQGVLNYYKYNKKDFWTNYYALIGVATVLFRIAGFIALAIRVRLHRKFYPEIL